MLKHVGRSRAKIAVVALAIVTALVVVGCGGGGSSSSSGGSTGGGEEGSGSEGHTIGVSILNARDPDLAAMTKAMESKASEENSSLDVTDAKQEVSVELEQMENLVTQEPEAIIQQPIDGEQSATAAERVISANIPLFILSTEFTGENPPEYISYIGVDDTEAGRMQGEFVNEQIPQGGKIIYIAGTFGASWTDRRKTGFHEVVNPNVEVASEFQANGDRGEAKRQMEDLLQKYPNKGEIAGIVAQNDEMAVGAASAIAQAGRQGDFKFLIGVDGTEPGLEAIAKGEETATVLQRSAEQGEKAVEVVNEYLDGKKVKKRYDLPFTLVTKENVNEFLK
ncbi:MAG: sugar ABC transporter substrate-binding protein [Actinobacteria bacterium]|nr:sugar ABC transporter substrate-binding protein [Actinomycetota bacterium]